LSPTGSAARVCELCGKDTRHDSGRCTNGRCGDCHRQHCTPGGSDSPGHGRGEEFGVVVLAQGRCTFASSALTRVEADALATQVGGTVVTLEELRSHKRAALGGGR
jgi:hypothetical protein